MRTQLKVIKADGSVEEYLHTKIIGAIANALAEIECGDILVAEELAEAITYYLYHKQNNRTITSDEIFSVIKAVLTGTGYENAALVLNEYNLQRRLKRNRLEVVSTDICQLANTDLLCDVQANCKKTCWDKSRIVSDLITTHNLDRNTARMIAGMVEHKVLNMTISVIPTSLIKQLVYNDTAAVLRAQRQLQMA